MSIDSSKISYVLNKYINGEICTGFEETNTLIENLGELHSIEFDSTGDPCGHELFEKNYSINQRNQGVNLKLYTFRRKLWSSGLDFYGFRLSNILRKIDSPSNIRLFLDNHRSNGAIIINEICVCRFSYYKEKPLALTFETDIGIIDEMRNKRISTNAIHNEFSEILTQTAFKNNKKIRLLRKIIINAGHELG